MSAKPTVAALVKESVKPLLAEHGFKKDALTFTRKRGDVLQIINVQISHGGASFYVNVGFIVGAMKKLRYTGKLGVGKYAVHHGARLDGLVRGAGKSFKAELAAGTKVRRGLEKLLPILEPIDSATALAKGIDLSRGFYKVTRAQLAYVTGRKAKALADLKAVIREFPSRHLTLAWLAKESGMEL